MRVMQNPTLRLNAKADDLPKITIVTPCFNHSAFIEATLLSVLNQGYPNLEYIVLDGGSTDGSAGIIARYSEYLAYWHSKPDQGQYHAIQDGFTRATGDIMAWLNSDDMLQRNSLWTVAEIFTQLPQVEWLLGNPTWYDSFGRTVSVGQPPRWSRYRYLNGDYKWIQQESVFWSRKLWQTAGSYIDTTYEYAADLELWMRFFRNAKLYSTSAAIAGFRYTSADQKGRKFSRSYLEEVNRIIANEPRSSKDKKILRKIELMEILLQIPVLRIFIKEKYKGLFEFPPLIQYNFNAGLFDLG